MTRLLNVIAAASLAAGFAATASVPLEPQAAAQIPGITAKDAFPNGCVSCHIAATKDGDVRLNVLAKKIPKHPALTIVKNVPNDCMRCHKAAVKSIPFGASVHKSHFGKLDKSKFVQAFKGECTHCHSFNEKTGMMTFKSGPKNW